jgi:hypothetical protein
MAVASDPTPIPSFSPEPGPGPGMTARERARSPAYFRATRPDHARQREAPGRASRPRLAGRAGLSSGPGDHQPRRPEGEARGRPGAAAGGPPGAAGGSSAASTSSPATAPRLTTPSATDPVAGVVDRAVPARVDPGRVHHVDPLAGDPVRTAEPMSLRSPRHSRQTGPPRVVEVTRQDPRVEAIKNIKIYRFK